MKGRPPPDEPAPEGSPLRPAEARITAWAEDGTPDPERTHNDRDEASELPPMPETVGRFRVCRPLGSGGMSVVYEAYDDRLDRQVALKLLRGRSKRRQARLQREAQALALLSHPNVVEVYEAGMHDGRAFLVMERLPGQPLQRWLAGTRPVAQVVECFMQAGRGLAAAHAQGLVHRDFKPSNVLVDADGRVRVFDFGLAAPSGDLSEGSADSLGTGRHSLASELLEEIESDASHEDVWETALTRTGAMLGTPAYMSPEQFEGRSASAKSDQFAFCVALYEALYGEHPFVEREQWERLARHVLEGRVREPPSGRPVPGALHRVIVRGLAVRPEGRWPSMDALLQAIGRAMTARRRVAWMASGVAVVAAAAGAGLWLSSDDVGSGLCSGGEAKLAEVWGPEHKRRVKEALLDTGVPYAGDTWRKVESRLDGYARAWGEDYRHACEDTGRHQSEEQMDGRMACLERRRRELGSLVEILAVADAGVVRQAITAVSQLDGSASCTGASHAGPSNALPSDPEVVREIAAQRDMLARARAMERAGQYRSGVELARPSATAADRIGFVPLQAEAQLQLGRLLRYLGAHEEAEVALSRAYFLAEEVEHDQVALDAVTMLTDLVARLLHRPEDGLEWVEHTRVAAQRVGGDAAWARYLNTHGQVLWSVRRHEEALNRFQEALPLYEQHWGPEHPLVAGVLNNTGLLLLEFGRPDVALHYIQRSLTIRRTALGPEHPEVGKMLNNQGLALRAVGRDDEALESFEQAHALRLRVLGPDHPDVAKPLANMASVLRAREEFDAAAEHAASALAIRQRAHGEDSLEAAFMHGLLGSIRLGQGRVEPARQRLTTAMLAMEQALGAEDVALIQPLVLLAESERQLVRLDDAAVHVERAWSLAEQHGVGPAERAMVLQTLAAVRWDQGDTRGARAYAQEAQSAYDGLSEAERGLHASAIEKLQAWLREHPSP